MTSALWLRDLGSYSLQVTLLVIAGALLARLFSLRASGATLAYWQVLLAGCLLLPVCQPWLPSAPRPSSAPTIGVDVDTSAAETARARRWTGPRLTERTVLSTLGAGVAVRGLWLGLGLWTLRRLRRGASPLSPEPPMVDSAQRETGVRAALFVSSYTDTPVTFGLRRPVVLLPPSVLQMDAQAQHTILTHELLHVKRHDYLWSVLEEGVRALLWFHPAVWWLIGRIHLTREQVVDQAVVGLTRSRERYVEALLAVARAKTQVRLVPAPLFLRRGLLKKRVAELFRETPMTTRRLLFCLTASAGLLILAAGGAVRLFPLEASAPDPAATTGDPRREGDKPEATLTAEAEQQLKRQIIELQAALEKAQASAEQKEAWKRQLAERKVLLAKVARDVDLSSDGETDRLRIVRGYNVERLEHVMKEVEGGLADPAITADRRTELEHKREDLRARMEGAATSIRVKIAEPRPVNGTLKSILINRVSERSWKTLVERLDVHVGDVINDEIATRVRETVTGVDEHYRAFFRREGEDGLILYIVGP